MYPITIRTHSIDIAVDINSGTTTASNTILRHDTVFSTLNGMGISVVSGYCFEIPTNMYGSSSRNTSHLFSDVNATTIS